MELIPDLQNIRDLQDIVQTHFFVPCPHHGEPTRFYCPIRHVAMCSSCKGSTHAVRVFRHMYHDVVRVNSAGRKPKDQEIQIFSANYHPVVFLRPFKTMRESDVVNEKHSCSCGRTISDIATYCSVACKLMMDSPSSSISSMGSFYSRRRPRKMPLPLRAPCN